MLRILLVCAVLCTSACAKHADAQLSDAELLQTLSVKADQGSAKAQYNLAMLYNNGIGTAQNPNRAFDLFQRSAAAGDPLASYKVGCYYAGQFGDVVEIDHDKALAAKLVAAKAGYFRAQSDVGLSYASKKDFVEAAKWWSAAAEQGDIGSLANLAYAYREGLGVPQDSRKALELLLIAKRAVPENQRAEVQVEIDNLKSAVSAERIAEAEAASMEWVPKPTELSVRANLGITEAQQLVQ